MLLARFDNKRVVGDNPDGPNIILKKSYASLTPPAVALLKGGDIYGELTVATSWDKSTEPATPYIYRDATGKLVNATHNNIVSASIYRNLGKTGMELEMGAATPLINPDGSPMLVSITKDSEPVQAIGYPLYIIGQERPRSLLMVAQTEAAVPVDLVAQPTAPVVEELDNVVEALDLESISEQADISSPDFQVSDEEEVNKDKEAETLPF